MEWIELASRCDEAGVSLVGAMRFSGGEWRLGARGRGQERDLRGQTVADVLVALLAFVGEVE